MNKKKVVLVLGIIILILAIVVLIGTAFSATGGVIMTGGAISGSAQLIQNVPLCGTQTPGTDIIEECEVTKS